MKIFERLHVRVRDIAYVNIIAHAAAIRRVVVVAENMDWGSSARGCKHQRNEMGFRSMCLADFAVWICPRGVEITQRNPW